MPMNHERRLDRLEEAAAPSGRIVFLWDDHKPGYVERKTAELAGSISQHDRIVTVSRER
jgi:hypothetical protein